MTEDVPPTFYPGTESSQIPSHYLPKDKGKGKETSPHTRHVNQSSQSNLEETIRMTMEMTTITTTHPEDHLQDHHHHPDLLVQESQHQHQFHTFQMERNEESNPNRSQMSKNSKRFTSPTPSTSCRITTSILPTRIRYFLFSVS
jgi:hypothetical protein